MYLVVFILHDPAHLDDLLTAWEATGVSGVTILTSSGLGRLRRGEGVRDDIPMMPSLDDFLGREPHLSRTLLSLVEDQSQVDALLRATRSVVGDLNRPQTGLFIVLPVSQADGLRKRGADSG